MRASGRERAVESSWVRGELKLLLRRLGCLGLAVCACLTRLGSKCLTPSASPCGLREALGRGPAAEFLL